MKRIVCFILILGMIVVTFLGCGAETDDGENGTTPKKQRWEKV